jgi:hypothetical protein
MKFASPFDERCFAYGPPAIFTLDPRGQLRLDPERTREIYIVDAELADAHDPGFFVLTDRATGLRMLMVVSHPAMATLQPRATSQRFPSYEEAEIELRGLGSERSDSH